ncbi:MAG: phosphoglucosamine mutase [Candidatus Thorarchaeota archaeon]
MAGKLFGTTGVRKVYGTEFNLDMALKLGKTLGTYLKKGTVVIGRDARTTGRMVSDALTAGILSTGIDVVDVGIIPTPTLAFTAAASEPPFSAGVMVTASHNPPEYTGVKFWNSNSMGYTPEMEAELERIFYSEEFQVANWDAIGSVSHLETAVEKHIQSLLENCDRAAIEGKNFKVVVDPGNGAACVLTPYLMQRLGCKVITINGQLDGHFPGRKSEPEEATLGDLISMVKETAADLGIAHDGDSDRVVFVSETGEVVRGDRTIALFAKEILTAGSSKTIVTTVDSSKVLDEVVKKAGGNTIRTPVGDIQVAIKLNELKAVHGGEACGVFLFPEFHLAPEPFLAACKVLELMAKTNRSFGELIAEIPTYPLLKTKIPVSSDKKNQVMKSLEQELPKAMSDVREVITVDGLGISLSDGWVLVRPSGTEPVIRITCEASSDERVREILEISQKVVQALVTIS